VVLNKAERRVLAKIGAFNQLSSHRRAAQWDVEAHVDPDDLFNTGICVTEPSAAYAPPPSPLKKMTSLERLHADYDGTRVTTGPHPMTFLRTEENQHLRRAEELKSLRHGKNVTVAGLVICRQRPGTANGHMFISLEDETGIANIFVLSDLFEKNRLIITQEPFLEIQGMLQNKEDVLSVLARKIRPIRAASGLKTQSHDFH
jgi:error-prone DNA polymerase